MIFRNTFFILIIMFLIPVLGSATVLLVEEDIDFKANWYQSRLGEEASFRRLIKVLKRSRIGIKLLKKAISKAYSQEETLLDVLHLGEVSVSDTTLIRKFYPSNPDKIIYETKSKVFLNRDLNTIDAVLDLAHELTHFIFRPTFNPYSSKFNLIDFIRSTIEGRGGEVDAYLVECKVLKELFSTSNRYSSNCKSLYDKGKKKFSREKGVQLFYQVGEYYDVTLETLNIYEENYKKLTKLSEREAIYISSAYNLPYPLAAVKEFMSIMDRVCINDNKRLALMKQKISRMPASITKEDKLQEIKDKYLSFQYRCRKHI